MNVPKWVRCFMPLIFSDFPIDTLYRCFQSEFFSNIGPKSNLNFKNVSYYGAQLVLKVVLTKRRRIGI